MKDIKIFLKKKEARSEKKNTCERCQNFAEEEKGKKMRQYYRKHNKNLSEDQESQSSIKEIII